MNNGKKNLIITVVVALAVSGLFAFIFGGGETTIREVVKEQLGGVNPDIPSRYLNWGGVSEWRVQASTAATSSVVCSFQNPSQATATIVYFGADITASGLGSQNVTLSTSTTNAATSSPALIYDESIGAGKKSLFWLPGATTTTATGKLLTNSLTTSGASPYIIGPSEYLNLAISTSSAVAGTFSSYLTGQCSAAFISPL